MILSIGLDATQEAAFQFLMDRANTNLAARKDKVFPSLDAYVLYLLTSYVAMETNGVAAERKAAVLRKLQDAPETITADDKATLGIV